MKTRCSYAHRNGIASMRYDSGGSICTTYLLILGYPYAPDTYTYGNSINGDRLMRYNNVSCVIDALGNPLRYANGTNYIMTWTKGRQLAKTVNGGVTTTYTYNADGIRTSKTVNGKRVTYFLDGNRILAEQNGSTRIRYFYDASGAPVGLCMTSSVKNYLFEKNLQGDIIGIYDTNGVKVVSYSYDAWGNIISQTFENGYETLATLNPFRYRGYYYDIETGFYYLQSRYYDPVTGRFLNADSYVNANGDITGFNMYAYCSNNPVMNVDPSGDDAIYVVYFNVKKEGLPFVGHAGLYFQDAYDVWYFTEFAGKKKKDAIVSLRRQITQDELDRIAKRSSNPLDIYTVYLKGDYSQCLSVAEKYEGGNYGGYNLFTNNCLHYVKEVLREREWDDSLTNQYINSSSEIIPYDFGFFLQFYTTQDKTDIIYEPPTPISCGPVTPTVPMLY